MRILKKQLLRLRSFWDLEEQRRVPLAFKEQYIEYRLIERIAFQLQQRAGQDLLALEDAA